MSTINKLRTSVAPSGSFVSVPEAFKNADEGLRYAVKVEFLTRFSEESSHPLKLEHTFSPQWVLMDLGAIDISAFDTQRMARDCELLKEAILKQPKKVEELLATFQSNDLDTNIPKALRIVEELELTEEATKKKGGGIVPLILLGVALLASGCIGTCTGSVKKDKPPR